jgi:hypothetical protein
MNRKDYLNGFTLFVAVVCALTISLNMFNGRFWLSDFRVYYSAALNFISGGPVYLMSYDEGSGFYKYSPATLFFFLPYLLMPYKAAAVIHFLIICVSYWLTFLTLRSLLAGYFFKSRVKHEYFLLGLSFGCILLHFSRETYLGNINIILLLLCCKSLQLFLAGRNQAGGLLLGVALLLKPYLVILLIPLLIRRKLIPVFWTLGTIVIISLFPFFYPGPSGGFALYNTWISAMLDHNQTFPGMTSIGYLITQYFFPQFPPLADYIIALVVYGSTALFIYINDHQEKKWKSATEPKDMNLAFEWFLLIALLPGVIKTDWVLLQNSAPLITMMIFIVAKQKQYLWMLILFILWFFYGANSDDLLGRTFSRQILILGVMGLSNLLIITISVILFLLFRKSLRDDSTPSH